MGFRAYLNTERIIKYDDGLFNHCFQDLYDFIIRIADEMEEENGTNWSYELYIKEEYCDCPKDEWVISKVFLEETIKYLKKRYNPNDIVFDDYTYQDITDTFERWLNLTKNNVNFRDNIYINWF